MSEASQHPIDTERQDIPAVGDLLRQAREARGLTVANVAQMLKLGVRQIEAMEAGRFDLLPGPAFVRGFLRNYARLLGIDADPLVEAVAPELSGAQRVELSPVSNADGVMPASGERRISSTPVALVAFGLLLVVLAGWYFDWFRTPDPVEMPVPLAVQPEPSSDNEPLFPPASDGDPAPAGVAVEPVLPPSEEAAAEEPAEPSVASPVQAAGSAAPASPAGTGGALELRFEGESWFEVRNAAGEIVATGIGRPGEVRSVRGTPPFALVIGNARDVRVTHNGRAVDLAPHTRVSVARLTVQ